MRTNLVYVGMGEQKIPKDYRNIVIEIAKELSDRGFIMRSGGSKGTETFFEKGTKFRNREIYLPWNGFNEKECNSIGNYLCTDKLSRDLVNQAEELIAPHHSHWDKLNGTHKRLYIKQVFQLLGRNLDSPTNFVLYYGNESGGVIKNNALIGIKLAKRLMIPTFNLADRKTLMTLNNILNKEVEQLITIDRSHWDDIHTLKNIFYSK